MGRIDPSFEHFKNEKVVFLDKPCVSHLAFEVCKAFADQRRLYARGAELSQVKRRKFIDIAA